MRALLLATALAFIATPGFAFDDPKALVAAIYAPYQTPGQASQQDPAQYYSERLKGFVSGHAAGAHDAGDGDAAPLLDFNPFINGQQSLLLDFTAADPVLLGDRATIAVSFHNFDRSTLLSLSLLREADGWKVDDVASLGQGEHWLYSWLLQYDPFSVN